MFCQWQHSHTSLGVDLVPVPYTTSTSLGNKLTYLINAALVVLIFAQCATPVAPRGGPKDHTPPSVVVEESTPNPMINFDLEEIRITLDEWVQLKNVGTEVIISPPIEPKPFPTLDRKTVIIPIDLETIQDNTTYTINFGEAIQDITERNPLFNHTFVFSKGDYVDSLSISGTVFNAHTGEPEPGARFILHDNLSDTAISRLLPSYFSSTDENGRFQLNFLRPDTFRGYAIKEAEFGNYRYDVGEQLGFLDEPVALFGTDTIDLRLWIFTPLTQMKAASSRRQEEAWKIALTREASFIELGGDTAAIIYWEHRADTIKLWHKSPDTLSIEILEAGVPFDTVAITPYIPEEASLSVSLNAKKQHPDDPVRILVTTPVASVDKSFFRVAQGDSVDLTSFGLEIDQLDPRMIYLSAEWVEKASYHVRLLPGAVTDIFGNSNDTLQYVISFDERVNFGLLNLTLTGIDSTKQYILTLLDHDKEVETRIMTTRSDRVLVFDRLPAREYMARIIEDRNANGIWDTGDLETKRQPERIFMQKIEGMRPGWDLDLTITWPEK